MRPTKSIRERGPENRWSIFHAFKRTKTIAYQILA
uniref:Uncharacterized protein n=1 Tax=Anguilla anguilla TaxID=7936 RepID=A0A0E9U5H9_ANGAN